jgi:excisionase family DNA binding protein
MSPTNEIGIKAVSVDAAAKALGICRNAAYAAVKTGEIPSINIGRRILVPIEWFKRFDKPS